LRVSRIGPRVVQHDNGEAKFCERFGFTAS
jgi:hypothetical protein